MKKETPLEKSYQLINHGPCPLITTGDAGERTVAPIAWITPVLDEPPMVLLAIDPGSYTSEFIGKTGEFAVNIMGEAHLRETYGCGTCSGRKTDKFKKFALTPVEAKRIKAPVLNEAVAHLECRLVRKHEYDGITLFVGEIIHSEAEEEFFDGKYLKIEKARTVHHMGDGLFTVSERIIDAKKL